LYSENGERGHNDSRIKTLFDDLRIRSSGEGEEEATLSLLSETDEDYFRVWIFL